MGFLSIFFFPSPFLSYDLSFDMQKPSHITNIHQKFYDFFPSSLGAIKVLHFTVRSEDGVCVWFFVCVLCFFFYSFFSFRFLCPFFHSFFILKFSFGSFCVHYFCLFPYLPLTKTELSWATANWISFLPSGHAILFSTAHCEGQQTYLSRHWQFFPGLIFPYWGIHALGHNNVETWTVGQSAHRLMAE